VTPERVNHRNGYRQRPFDTRVGTIEMAIPKLRRWSYFPNWLLDPRRRAENALVAVVAECYMRGVSTRRVGPQAFARSPRTSAAITITARRQHKHMVTRALGMWDRSRPGTVPHAKASAGDGTLVGRGLTR
jgi:hypothetical protein